jgi:hypothetical protein
MDNHRKYIEKAIKSITKAIYKDRIKKRNKLRETEEENT